MLIVPDKNDLGDLRLSPEEGVAKLKESNAKLTAQYKIPNQALLENRAAGQGTVLQPSEFILKLQRLNSSIIIEKGGVPGAVAVRFPVYDPEEKAIVKKYISGFYVDRVLPESSSVIPDEHGKPWREQRGWRSILLALMKVNALTYRQVKNVFGVPGTTRKGLWDQQTRIKRA